MQPIRYEATQRAPRVDFDFDAGCFVMEGEIYPEDAAAFFGPLLDALKAFLEQPQDRTLRFDFCLQYFNSSSAKGLMNLFQMLEEAAGSGQDIVIHWHYQTDDDTILEAGEDFAEDLETAKFVLCPMEVT